MFINFNEIPGNTKLFLDYINSFEKVQKFYKYNFRDKEHFIAKFKQLAESPKEFRNELSSIINNQYKSLNPSSKTSKKYHTPQKQRNNCCCYRSAAGNIRRTALHILQNNHGNQAMFSFV